MADTHFVVERLNWRRVGDSFHRLPGETRVATFPTADAAEAFRLAEEERARAVVNPFLGGLAVPADQTNWPPDLLCDWLMDHDIDPPAPATGGACDWAGWWAQKFPGWTADQRAAAWRVLDKVQFFRVREARRRPVAYAVVQVDWGYNDEWNYRNGEGGTVETLFRRRERAEVECDEMNRLAREGWGFDTEFDDSDWRDARRDPFAPPPPAAGRGVDLTPAAEATFYEVVEVELEGEA